jgi:hypothetical protein
MSVNCLDNGLEHRCLYADCARKHAVIVLEGMAQADDGAIAKFRLGRIHWPAEDAVEHLSSISLVDISFLVESIVVRIGGAVLDIDEVRVLLDTRRVEVHLLQQILPMCTWMF